jgi:hypothetical protein
MLNNDVTPSEQSERMGASTTTSVTPSEQSERMGASTSGFLSCIKFLILFSILLSTIGIAEVDFEPLTSTGLTDDVMSSVKNPTVFDWRNRTEFDLGYVHVDERNNFESSGYKIGMGIPFGSGMGLRLGLSRIEIRETKSSRDVGRTPFKQGAGVNRYELMFGFAISVLEGRSITWFSPFFPDFSHALSFVIGGHVAHPNEGWMPQKNDKQEPYPGQDQWKHRYAIEAALRWQMYFPAGIGIYFETTRNFALAGHGQQWQNYTTGVSWAP